MYYKPTPDFSRDSDFICNNVDVQRASINDVSITLAQVAQHWQLDTPF